MNPLRLPVFLLTLFLPSWVRQPKVGDVYVHVADDLDPFYPIHTHTIKEIRGKHLKYVESWYQQEWTTSTHDFLVFYRLYKEAQS